MVASVSRRESDEEATLSPRNYIAKLESLMDLFNSIQLYFRITGGSIAIIKHSKEREKKNKIYEEINNKM